MNRKLTIEASPAIATLIEEMASACKSASNPALPDRVQKAHRTIAVDAAKSLGIELKLAASGTTPVLTVVTP